ncbi:MAG: type II toxin-antitoxin system RelE/ParE family toxin [Clostridia bacterium]|nr:type II toxin-antitoxin system RelE/ParE family toxin [Clostridia bacterium]
MKEGKSIKKKEYKITYSRDFRQNLKEVHKSLNEYYDGSYGRFDKRLNKNLERLKLFPHKFQTMENEKEFRRFFIQNYVIIYKVEINQIILFRILPNKSNYIQEGIYKTKFPKKEIKI